MNDAVRVPTNGLLTTSELAARADFTLGLAAVSPSSRTIAGPGGTADVEPRVMQVLVVLADSAGQVVTREILFQRCWGGVYVGDDSLNRAIGAVRKLASDIAGGSFEIETIPRTGYRLTGADAAPVEGSDAPPSSARGVSRRQVAGGVAGIAALGAVGGWALWSSSPQRDFDALLGRAEDAIRKQTNDEQTTRDLERAVALRPGNARAWGLLAFVKSSATLSAFRNDADKVLNEAQEAARKALAIDPKEPYALLAMVELQGSTIDWFERDQRLRRIIAIDPSNIPAIGELILLTQAAGLNRESWTWNERAIALDPFSFDYLSKRALKLWIAGRVNEADKVIDQVQALYPRNPWPWDVRFMIYALTGRARAARAMLETKPENLGPPQYIALWRATLPALEQPTAERMAQAKQACFRAAEAATGFASDTVMILSALGDVDGAYQIAEGALLSRGAVVRKGEMRPKDDLNDATWRINTQWLFTPPCKIVRADARFLPLCEGVGLVEYWKKRGVEPDYMRIERARAA